MRPQTLALAVALGFVAAWAAPGENPPDRLEKEWKANKQVKPLLDALRSSDPEMRQKAAQLLGDTQDPQVVDPLLSVLHDSDSYVRVAAVYSLGSLHDGRAVPALAAALRGTANPVEAGIVLTALGNLCDLGGADVVLAVLNEKGTDPHALRSAIRAAAKCRDRRAIDFLVPMVSDLNPDIRKNAAESLLSIDEARGLEALDAALTSPDTKVRLAAEKLLRATDTRGKPSRTVDGVKLTLLGIERVKTFDDPLSLTSPPARYSAKRGYEIAVVHVRLDNVEKREQQKIVSGELIDAQQQKYPLGMLFNRRFNVQFAGRGDVGTKRTLDLPIGVPEGASLRSFEMWGTSFDLSGLEGTRR